MAWRYGWKSICLEWFSGPYHLSFKVHTTSFVIEQFAMMGFKRASKLQKVTKVFNWSWCKIHHVILIIFLGIKTDLFSDSICITLLGNLVFEIRNLAKHEFTHSNLRKWSDNRLLKRRSKSLGSNWWLPSSLNAVFVAQKVLWAKLENFGENFVSTI